MTTPPELTAEELAEEAGIFPTDPDFVWDDEPDDDPTGDAVDDPDDHAPKHAVVETEED